MIRSILLTITTTLLLISCQTNQPQGTEKTGENGNKALHLSEITLQVHGMTCEGCENTINEYTEKLPGVAKTIASHANATAVLQIDTTITKLATVINTIEKLGYQVK